MSNNLMFFSTAFSLFIILFILILLRNDKITIKYSLVWVFLFALILLSILIPGFLNFITKILGFQIPSNMIISLILSVLIVISIILTIIVSQQNKKIRLLIQEISLLKKKVDKK